MEQQRINFYSENSFILEQQDKHVNWIERVVGSEERKLGELSYIFCDDEYLLQLNKDFLQHDTYTDVITFDYCVGKILQGDIYISTQRVKDNAETYDAEFNEELRRVIIHGILHLCGYKDKTDEQSSLMRQKEEEKMQLFHVEQF